MSHIQAFKAGLRGSTGLLKGFQSFSSTRRALFVCRTCQRKFSNPPNLRLFQNAAKQVKTPQKYPSRMLIYDAGDARSTWIIFWKTTALIQLGIGLFWYVPRVWNDENQPDAKLRKGSAIFLGVLATVPSLTLAYLTAPFTWKVYLQLPEYARRSRQDLVHFARSLNAQKLKTANTKLEFVTLRIFPRHKVTGVFLHELRALPPTKLRLANIELPKSDAWAERQRAKGIFRRMWEVLNEPRFKFYIKEGRMYTMSSGAPGVWEEVAKRIKDQTPAEEDSEQEKPGQKKPGPNRPVAVPATPPKIKRQTSRANKD